MHETEEEDQIFHSGTGRIAPLRMHPMSLFESGDSTGEASITDMLNGSINDGYIRKVELDELARLIIRGGWPANLRVSKEDSGIIPESYFEAIVTKDMHEGRTRKRSPGKMRMLLRSLSRNESTVAGNKTLVRDIEEYEGGNELIESRATVADYLGGKLYHFRDNVSGDEVDAIIEFKDGNYAAFEIKLSDGSIQEAMDSLKTFYMHADKKPDFMCVIVGHLETVMCDPLSGIFITPITSLRP